MTFEDEITNLEKRLQGYKNSYQFSIKSNNPSRQAKYRSAISATELQIRELEKTTPNAIQRLNDKITDLHIKIDELTNKEHLAKQKGIELQKQINEFAKIIPEPQPEQLTIPEIIPEVEVIPEVETEPVAESIIEPEPLTKVEQELIPKPEGKIPCPDCGKMVNSNPRSLRTHQSQWCVKKEVKIS